MATSTRCRPTVPCARPAAFLWDLNDDIYLHSLEHNDVINALCFSLNRYWLCFAYGPSIKIWDLACKTMVEELKPSNAILPQCLSLARSTDGQTLYAGYSDNIIRVWQVDTSRRQEKKSGVAYYS
ncbi:hypothetical protein pipiens_005780 [Culex pipiens pipiens]|uniref:Small ribosomal subunit protein RACK1 n=1 Tax=Culex pipiens pipiens TaxID=38569 RepID=A0ABD1DTY8_CULPP